MNRLRSKGFLFTAAVFAIAAYGQNNPAGSTLFRCKPKLEKKTILLNSSGENVEGPVCAEVSINALRYGAEFGSATTDTNGPNLGSIFPSSFTPGSGAPEPPAQSLEAEFRQHQRALNAINLQFASLQGSNRTAAAALDAALRTLKDLVSQSDMTFTNFGSSGVLSLVRSDAFQKALNDALTVQLSWANSDQLLDALRSLQIKLNALPLNHPANTDTVTADFCTPANIVKLGWSDWDTKCRDSEYKQSLATLAQLQTDAGQFSSDGERAATIAKKLGVATFWKNTADALTADSFVRQFEIGCPALFNKNRQVALKLILTDRLPSLDLQGMSTSTKDNILVVQCGSRFAISAGAVFSGIPNTEFAIVKSSPTAPATTSTNRFGILSDPSIHPLPMAIVHARLWEPNNVVAFHTSFGVGVNVRSQASGGSSPEFLLGPSISLFRTIFFSGGAEIGKSTALAGGFHVNDVVPSDVNAPQIATSYTTRWGFAVTFTKP